MTRKPCQELNDLLERPVERVPSEAEFRAHFAKCAICEENHKNFKPVKVKGEPLSETLKKDRR